LNLFRRKPVPPKKPCCVRCDVYEDVGASSRDLFDEDFPTSSTLITSFGRSGRAGRRCLNCEFECKTDGALNSSLNPEWSPLKFLHLSAGYKKKAFDSVGTLTAEVADIPKLPGLLGQVVYCSKTDKYRVKTQYRHPYFSIVADNAYRYSGNLAFNLNAVGCISKAGLTAGVNTKIAATKDDADDDANSKYQFALDAVNVRLSFIRGAWNVFFQSQVFDRDYTLAIARNVLLPFFRNEAVIGARFAAHAARPDLSKREGVKAKMDAICEAVRPQAVVAMRTKLSESSFIKMKMHCAGEDVGRIQFGFSEQLSQYARAVFGLKLNTKNLFNIPKNMLCFTLKLSN